jgi:DNA replication protein DnaC
MIDRERRMIERRIKAAKFPAVKSLDSFDFKAIPALNKMQVLELARCEWVERRENVIALGPSGTGKTHIALGLGLSACQKGLSVGFVTAAALVHELMEARDERRLLRLQKQMVSHKLRPAGLRGRTAATVPSDHRRTGLRAAQQNRR